MRYRQAHAAKSGSVPFMLRGPKPLRTAVSAALAGVIGLVPVTFIASPAAAVTAASYTLAATPNPVVEKAGAKVTITATLSETSATPTTIDLTTGGGTATPDVDYVSTTTTPVAITIPANTLTGSAEIGIMNDGVKDQLDSESFNVTGALTGAAPVLTVVNIEDAQKTPKLTLSGPGSTEEGDDATFTITPDVLSELPITVQWNSVDPTVVSGHGTATAGKDFTYPGSRTVTILAGGPSGTITIPTADDSTFEGFEDYAIELASPTNAVLGTPSKVTSTIADPASQVAPTVTFAPTAVAEGNSGQKAQEFTASLDVAAGLPLKVDWRTAPAGVGPGFAIEGRDYLAAHGSLTFPADSTKQTFTVDIIGDTIDEGPDPRVGPADGEVFNIVPSGVVGAITPTLGSPETAITITDDDAAPTASFGDLAVKEGDDANPVLLPIKLQGSSDQPITFDIVDAGTGTAASTSATIADPLLVIGGYDYSLLNATATILPEQSSGYVAVLVNGDTMFETNETVNLTATPASGDAGWLTAPGTDAAVLTLDNDDKAPNLQIDSATGKEGDTVAVTGTVTGTAQAETRLTISFAGKAAGGNRAADTGDFTNPGSKEVIIAPGTPSGTVIPVASIKLTEDSEAEPSESIVVSGTGFGNTGTVTEGVVTIEGTAVPIKPTLTAVPTTTVGVATVKFAGKATASSAVTLWGKAMGSTSFSKLRETTSDANGNYSFSLALSRGFVLHTSVGETYSKDVTVKVQQKPTLTATSPSKDKVSITVTGDPKAAGSTVAVQSLVGGAWKTLYTGKLGTNGSYAKSITTTASTLTLRASVYGNSARGILFGTSATKKITVK
ncbi:Calx-beta domain-containing protein [Actinoplanes regularis]|uniref:Calx-beta domain-containing protein n=1 Tax=Actinoplanes regularis TaxID=52697 RepID=A0A238URA2_9ACTN|nr:Calx-beta domain-containing protein [Actinoplanes regularis]GIE84511.1 hypothetical protein Are01nite_09910 [Actinoplanes regularis]SNR24635.1 Calx-beta domain-containing protein [Actinoplanes regularis]